MDATSASNVNIVKGEPSETANAEKAVRHSSHRGISMGMRHLAIICAFELISLFRHLDSAQHQGNARCTRGVRMTALQLPD